MADDVGEARLRPELQYGNQNMMIRIIMMMIIIMIMIKMIMIMMMS